MNKLAVTKTVARFVVGSGTTTISNAIIRNNVAPTNLYTKVSIVVASVVIGSMASEATKAHTDKQIDAIADAFRDMKQKQTEDSPESV